ncbi:hypothetical protein MTR_3g106540 [Medicago truncatula]|uniref:Uncharacterized protein n=1 Tax=Medicago truncatula TaxID=3880 RepID=G7JAF5_MEDTR|nr:hypothetical protein MTR_3g106540 [Medicago truncatula]
MKSTNKGRNRIWDRGVVAHGGEWDGGEGMIIDDTINNDLRKIIINVFKTRPKIEPVRASVFGFTGSTDGTAIEPVEPDI